MARKSSITRMWSSGDKNFFETITSYTLPCVNDWILVLKLLSSRLILFDFFANTTGTSNSLATIAAIPIPLASIVRILLIFLSANNLFHSFAISSKSFISIWWLIKLSTLRTLPSLIIPSFLILSSNNFITVFLFYI